MITKTVIKDYVFKKCPYLVCAELEDRTLVDLLKKSIDSKNRYKELASDELEESGSDKEGPEDEFDIFEVVKDYPHLRKEVLDYYYNIPKNPVEKLIEQYNDDQIVGKLSRRYFELKYGEDKCVRCDVDGNGDEITNQKVIVAQTEQELKDPDKKVIFEGQIEFNKQLRARFDILIKNDDGSFDIIEAKGTNDVFEHPSDHGEPNYDADSKIKLKYLYDLGFQYYIYDRCNMNIRSIAYMFTDRDFKLKTMSYPVSDSDLNELFIIKPFINLKLGKQPVTTIPLKEYFDKEMYATDKSGEKILDTVEEVIDAIRYIHKHNQKDQERRYICRKGPRCPFIEDCFKDANDSNSIFKLTNWNLYGGFHGKTAKLMEQGIFKISDIPTNTFEEIATSGKREGYRNNVFTQIQFQLNQIKGKYLIDKAKVKEILERDYLNDDIKYLLFFDFESFQYPIPLVNHSFCWKQVVSQYSMHIVRNDYDMSKHDFEKGVGGEIRHYEFIGNPDIDKFENPSIRLYETLRSQLIEAGIDPMGDDYRVIVFNRNFEKSRMNEFCKQFIFADLKLREFVQNFNDNVVDLLDFFTSGGIYGKDFNGRGSLKVVQPTLAADPDVLEFYSKTLPFDLSYSLDYHKGDKCLVYNGAICLDLYKSLLVRSHKNIILPDEDPLSTKNLLKEALAYCKIDSWGTVVIFDIVRNIYEGKLELDAKYC